MEESVTYQAIIRKGEAKGLAKGIAEGKREGAIEAVRSVLVSLGTERWGKPSSTIARHLDRIHNRETLEHLTKQVLHANSWNDLLAALED